MQVYQGTHMTSRRGAWLTLYFKEPRILVALWLRTTSAKIARRALLATRNGKKSCEAERKRWIKSTTCALVRINEVRARYSHHDDCRRLKSVANLSWTYDISRLFSVMVVDIHTVTSWICLIKGSMKPVCKYLVIKNV